MVISSDRALAGVNHWGNGCKYCPLKVTLMYTHAFWSLQRKQMNGILSNGCLMHMSANDKK